MIRPIYTYGEDILRKTAEQVDLNDPDLPVIVADMFDTMRNAEGIGLAAPQIGISKRILIIEDEIKDGEVFKGVFINPNIIAYSGREMRMDEGCLSFPGINESVIRPEIIDVEWYDEQHKYHREILSGIQSRIFQHEFDHLNGSLFIDKIHPIERLNIFMNLEKIKNKSVKTKYILKI